MKWFLLLLISACVVGGCKPGSSSPTNTTEAAADVAQPELPTRAQPKLQTLKLWLGAEEMTAELALTGPQIRTGMMFRTNIADNAGMLFVFSSPRQVSFWMKNCPLPLSAAYIDPNGAILEVRELDSFSTNSVTANTDRVQYVLETGRGWFERNNVLPGMVVRTERGALRQTFFSQKN